MESTDVLLYEHNEHIARIVLNRPRVRNAINAEMTEQLIKALDRAAQDEDVYAVIITGAGEKAFSAGFDLKESLGSPITNVPERRENTRTELGAWMKIWDMHKPVIAAVQGYCVGGALHLALMCDLIIAADNAQFGEPEIAFSYIPDVLIEPFKLPPTLARELVYLGEYIPAQRMYDVGAVNRVVPLATLQEDAMSVARRIAGMPREAMRMLKHQFNKAYEIMGIKDSMEFAAELFNMCRIYQAQSETKFNEIANKQGLKEALAWKEAQQQ